MIWAKNNILELLIKSEEQLKTPKYYISVPVGTSVLQPDEHKTSKDFKIQKI